MSLSLQSIAYRETICYNQEKEVIYEFDQSINYRFIS